jgi:hypothetical protein
MAYWIFKLADQKLYPDVHGSKYVYDNTHSVRVRAGDVFLYLDKSTGYSFTATGVISRITQRDPTASEAARNAKVRAVFTAHLSDVVEFSGPLSISPATKLGRVNRAKLGILDANLLGWSQSMPLLSESWYQAIMDFAQEKRIIPSAPEIKGNYSVPDKWAMTKIRQAAARFSNDVCDRHGGICVVCGTKVPGMVDAAHISPYAADEENRANAANGICLCTFCHRAMDRRLIAIAPNGELLIAPEINDNIAMAHFKAIDANTRRMWLSGVEAKFLELTVKWFNECH